MKSTQTLHQKNSTSHIREQTLLWIQLGN